MHPARSITMKYRMQYAITNWTRLCRLEKGVSVCGWWARKGCAQCGLGGICVSVVEWGREGEGRGPWGPPAFIKQLQFQSPVWHICTRWAKAKLLLRGIAALEHEHDGTRITTRSLSCPLIALPLTTYKSLSCSLSGKTLEHRGANEQFYSNDTLSLLTMCGSVPEIFYQSLNLIQFRRISIISATVNFLYQRFLKQNI